MKLGQSKTKLIVALLTSSMLLNTSLHAEVVVIETPADFDKLIESKRPAVLKFSAEWCGACQAVKDDFDATAGDDEFKNVAFVRIDMDKLGSVGQRYNVTGMPTFVFLENGSEKSRKIGASAATFKEEIRSEIKNAFGSSLNETNVDAKGQVAPAAEQAAPAPAAAQEPAAEGGFVAQIKALIMWVVNGIKHMVMYVVDAIKGLFSK